MISPATGGALGSGSMWAQSFSPKLVVRNAEDRTAAHAGQGDQRHLDFGGIDVDPARDSPGRNLENHIVAAMVEACKP